MKNKKISIILSLILILGMTVPVFAASQEITTSGTTTVSYGVTEGYTVSIPANFEFTTTTLEQTQTVSASNVLLEDGATLNVTMESANYTAEDGYTLNCETTSKIPYSIKKGDAAFENGSVVLSVQAGSTSGEDSLVFSTTTDNISKASLSGKHTDTLTFEVSLSK